MGDRRPTQPRQAFTTGIEHASAFRLSQESSPGAMGVRLWNDFPRNRTPPFGRHHSLQVRHAGLFTGYQDDLDYFLLKF